MLFDILNNPEKLIFVALTFVMLMDLIVAFVFFIISIQFIANSITVKARITKLEVYGNQIKAYISLIDQLGRTVNTAIIVQLNKYKESDEIEILSHKDNPAKVKLNSFLSLWMLPVAILQGAIMIGLLLVALVSMDIAKLPF